jgi:hypothetical protein
MNDLNTVQTDLAKPFDESEMEWKPQVTSKGKRKEPIMKGDQQIAGCTAHIDARAVMNRLDDVVGVGGWSDSYAVLDGKHVECTLTVWGVSKSDVGETNEGGFADPIKSAYSDALKRAAVKFGIGRHLYDMEMEWLPFDGYKIIEQRNQQRQQAKPKAKAPAAAVFEDGKGNNLMRDEQNKAEWGADSRGEMAPDAQAKRKHAIAVDTAVMVIGKNDEKPGVITGFGFAEDDSILYVVTVDGKEYRLAPDKFRAVVED